MCSSYGSPGTGKSTIAAQLFSLLKWNKIRCELVTEYAKELVWEERGVTIKNQLYIFSKQHHKIFKLLGKVDYIISDSPLLLSGFYAMKNDYDNPFFIDLIKHEFDKDETIDIFLKRTKEYDTVGRIHTEEESNQYSIEIKKYLDNLKVNYSEFDATEYTAQNIFDFLFYK